MYGRLSNISISPLVFFWVKYGIFLSEHSGSIQFNRGITPKIFGIESTPVDLPEKITGSRLYEEDDCGMYDKINR